MLLIDMTSFPGTNLVVPLMDNPRAKTGKSAGDDVLAVPDGAVDDEAAGCSSAI